MVLDHFNTILTNVLVKYTSPAAKCLVSSKLDAECGAILDNLRKPRYPRRNTALETKPIGMVAQSEISCLKVLGSMILRFGIASGLLIQTDFKKDFIMIQQRIVHVIHNKLCFNN